MSNLLLCIMSKKIFNLDPGNYYCSLIKSLMNDEPNVAERFHLIATFLFYRNLVELELPFNYDTEASNPINFLKKLKIFVGNQDITFLPKWIRLIDEFIEKVKEFLLNI